jgi:hypothetical protein
VSSLIPAVHIILLCIFNSCFVNTWLSLSLNINTILILILSLNINLSYIS